MRSFFCESIGTPGAAAELEEREAEHLFRVLRAVPGDEVTLLDGRGGRAAAVVRPGRRLEVLRRETVAPERPALHLYCAMPRRNRLDAMLTQAVEVGAAAIHPVRFARSVAEPEPGERWLLHLREGCKQSGNPYLPELLPTRSFSEALAEAAASTSFCCYGAIGEGGSCAAPAGSVDAVGWFVGPEGGFTPEETESFRAAGVKPLNLGPHVLRLETAAVCGLAVLRRILRAAPAAVLAAMLLAGGCGRSDGGVTPRHPLLLKAEYYREHDDPELARRFYRRLLAGHPEAAAVHLRLATLCDESLELPVEALYHYDEYLRLTPEGAPGRASAADYRRLAAERFRRDDSAELERLREENRMLRRQLVTLKRLLSEHSR